VAGGDPRRRLGEAGESLACRHLEARGFAVVERNFRTRYGELDVVAADSRYLVFCEVKTRIVRGRPGPLGPFAAIGARKRRQVRLMAREWLARDRSGGRPRPPELRFDAIGVSFDPSGRLVELDHLEDAF
jgi:putative endonuclease